MLQPRTNGILLSEQIAANLGLQVGDVIHNSANSELYINIPVPLQVVGILESDVRLSIASYEYFDNYELLRRRAALTFLVVAQPGREAAVDGFLRNEIESARTPVRTYQELKQDMASEYQATYSLLVPVILLVMAAITLAIGIVNRIAFSRRVSEFGILHAVGHGKKWLARRLTLETGALACAGWALGVGISWLALYALELGLFAPRGHELDVVTLRPALFVVPVPLAVIGFTLFSSGRIFARLDSVSVVERGQLGLQGQRQQSKTAQSSSRPLASWTFYRRHKQRAVLSTGAMALMIIAVVMFIFLLTATRHAQTAYLGNLSRMSLVFSASSSRLDPGVISQVRTHPTVERAIPFVQYTMLSILIPPGESSYISPFGVYAEDMAYLVELYGLELAQGSLPRPHTNEIVIPQAVAQNRDLQVGDVIGDPERPAYPGASSIVLPTPFVISGIFAQPSTGEENWLSFVSLEFMASHKALDIPEDVIYPLIVVPKDGQKAALDDWLENELAGDAVQVRTYGLEASRAQEKTRTQVLTIALLESGIAIVAAAALAALNYISVSQRRAEFGALHALGYSRARLVWRAIKETVFTTGAAWGFSAALFLVELLYFQFGLFGPLGLRLNPFNLTPWLFTLPIPVAVLAVAAGTLAWTLSRLDPVSIIERR
jgi:ABC-type lipoprotein release transport system permease subunit